MKRAANLSGIPCIAHGFCNASDNHLAPAPITMNQVHGSDALFISEPPAVPPAVDALITDVPGLTLAVKSADCAPILLADPHRRIIAAVHAGWRGAFQGIIETTLLEMLKRGARIDAIVAAIGPHIQAQSFGVGPEMRALFPPTESRLFSTIGTQTHFDFDAYVVHRLKRSGVVHIESAGDDTYSNPEYLSFRRDPANPAREFSFIRLI